MKILLIGNYVPDAQESMQRYSEMLANGLKSKGHNVEIIRPPIFFGRLSIAPLKKYLRYFDKLLIFPAILCKMRSKFELIHICDHSNAFYIPFLKNSPHVITCHDVIAIRGALGEIPDARPSFLGRFLQKLILNSLKQARAIICVSSATKEDLSKIIATDHIRLKIILHSLNYHFKPLNKKECKDILAPFIPDNFQFILSVGNNHPRKNRIAVIHSLGRIKDSWHGKVLFAGVPLSEDLHKLIKTLELEDRILEIAKPTNELLNALYARAHALFFPSRYEGFGWPLIEAQSAATPVICSNAAPFREVAGEGALYADSEDYEEFGKLILKLENKEFREQMIRKGLQNAKRFSLDHFLGEYLSFYQEILADYEHNRVSFKQSR